MPVEDAQRRRRLRGLAQGVRSELHHVARHHVGMRPAFQQPSAQAFGPVDFLTHGCGVGYGRDPLAPIKDAVTADGDVVVPLDAEAFGFWLKAAFGSVTG